ncbi:hypothetical protein SERLADRAFT_451130 [Serpula lacrymans var. lacrymans S7.9]|uniref:Ubiquitin 3 binding protein But2 C-terminal domain-containing protein n=1 Tax=Serpula lacrymans var. lacrymans (strain S7.9) TaxID=578457 RepID=F8P405_SERL9|nr:uncharacterized protein SERLADRAFT_451130 [Serpula lacrymans var. lacrymans S7.9]EGO22253.1 hypothetical protein SERLADRAFT_451130 [Serpula lacrymans var. lacrymans S7.9]
MTPIGTISPEDRRVHITPTISTILQFRALDFGMEHCQLQVVLPTSVASKSSTTLEPSSLVLELNRLDASGAMDASTLSYKTCPGFIGKIADIKVDYGLTWSHNFTCATDEVITFELACSSSKNPGGECYVDWWQTKGQSNPAVFLTQHTSV